MWRYKVFARTLCDFFVCRRMIRFLNRILINQNIRMQMASDEGLCLPEVRT